MPLLVPLRPGLPIWNVQKDPNEESADQSSVSSPPGLGKQCCISLPEGYFIAAERIFSRQTLAADRPFDCHDGHFNFSSVRCGTGRPGRSTEADGSRAAGGADRRRDFFG